MCQKVVSLNLRTASYNSMTEFCIEFNTRNIFRANFTVIIQYILKSLASPDYTQILSIGLPHFYSNTHSHSHLASFYVGVIDRGTVAKK